MCSHAFPYTEVSTSQPLLQNWRVPNYSMIPIETTQWNVGLLRLSFRCAQWNVGLLKISFRCTQWNIGLQLSSDVINCS